MNPSPLKSRLVLALVALVAALGVTVGAQARIPVEPGPGSPVTHQHGREPAKQKSKQVSKRNEGGFPASSGSHVKSQAEARTE